MKKISIYFYNLKKNNLNLRVKLLVFIYLWVGILVSDSILYSSNQFIDKVSYQKEKVEGKYENNAFSALDFFSLLQNIDKQPIIDLPEDSSKKDKSYKKISYFYLSCEKKNTHFFQFSCHSRQTFSPLLFSTIRILI